MTLQEFRQTAAFLESTPARGGTFMGKEPITPGSLLAMMREHDEGHRKELQDLARRSGAAGA
jgi:hypothetical protein